MIAMLRQTLSPLLENIPHITAAVEWERVYEMRMRVGVPLCICTADGQQHLGTPLSAAQIQEAFYCLCSRAVHTHESELANGFITTSFGVRVGVAGTAVVRDGRVTTYRDITSLCVRLPHDIVGAALPLMPYLMQSGAVQSLLICGAPGSGKTTLLRDAARQLSASHRITVVDERGELAGNATCDCDVLKGCPKSVGIRQAVRTLAPDAVIADELGDETEWHAVAHAAYCGVPIIASAHIGAPEQVVAHDALVQMIRNGGLTYTAFLPPRCHPDGATQIWKARDLLENRGNRVDCVRLRGNGYSFGVASA